MGHDRRQQIFFQTEPNVNHDVTPPQPTLSRRTMIINVGVATAALTGLSACTTYGAPSTNSSSPAAAAATTTVKAADIPVGSGKIFADTQTVVTQPTKGSFKAFSSICTHQSCPVAEITTTINCSCHGSKFSITDGSVVNPPAEKPLPAKAVKVDGGTLTIS
jgi:nitrite reductase/ring-hydroxylating ferredoxin subunit